MSYFKSEKHFANYIRQKTLSSGVEIKMMSMKYKQIGLAYYYNELLVIDKVLPYNFIKPIAWEIKGPNDKNTVTNCIEKIIKLFYELHSIIHEDVSVRNCPVLLSILKNFSPFTSDTNILEESKRILENLHRCCGLYFLYNENLELMYIGRSVDLCNRIPGSAQERGLPYFKYLILENEANTYILEPTFITKFKPPLNGEFSTMDIPTLQVNFDVSEPSMKAIRIFDSALVTQNYNLMISTDIKLRPTLRDMKQGPKKPTFKVYKLGNSQ